MSIDPTGLGTSGFIPLSATGGPSGGSSPSPSGTSGQSSGANSLVNESSFFQLLVAELQNQNPLQPVSNTQFVSQLAQFQTLNVMQYILEDLDQLVTKAGGTPADASSGATPQSSGTPPASGG